ncbi:hypothetical protein [Promicromonospora soli]
MSAALSADLGMWHSDVARALVETSADLPGWATFVLWIVVVGSGFVLGLIRRLVPRDSNDRLQWWIALLAHRRDMAWGRREQERTHRLGRGCGPPSAES